MDIVESMLYFWQATNDKEKVGEKYITSIADRPEMLGLYDDEFTKESVRKVLSAISNRELLNSRSIKERRFWNNNMWMMEDVDYTFKMIAPVKVLNVNAYLDQINTQETTTDTVDIYFVPGLHDTYKIVGHKIYINFFKVKPDLINENNVTIDDLPIQNFVVERIIEAVRIKN
jgi:hypothetical protein